MPLPLLPFDVISESIDHLRNESTAKQVSDGQSISLVCKAWRPLGQALRWRRIGIDRRQISSIFNHFYIHAELGGLVRDCLVLGTLDNSNTDDHEEEEDDEAHHAQLPGLLTRLPNLESITITSDLGKFLGSTFQALSELSKLNETSLCVAGRPEWWSEIVSSLSSGFKKLSDLVFVAPGGVVNEIPVDDIQPSADRIKLKMLMIGWDAVPAINSQLAERFLSRLDPNTLQVVNLLDSATCTTSLKWLLGCPSLVNLSIALSLDQVHHDFPDHLSMLPQFPSLKLFEVGLIATPINMIPSPVPLSAILASFSPTLRAFRVQQFVFSDLDTLTRREVPIPTRESIRLIEVLCPGPVDGDGGRGGPDGDREAVEMSVWGEESEGVITWFCDVVSLEGTSS